MEKITIQLWSDADRKAVAEILKRQCKEALEECARLKARAA